MVCLRFSGYEPSGMGPKRDTEGETSTKKLSGFRLVRSAINVLAIFFVVLAVSDLWQRWDKVDARIGFWGVFVALMWACVAMLAQFLSWRALIRGWTARKMPWVASAKVYMDSQLARYTPGKVALPAIRIAGAPSVGVSPKVMVTSLSAELLSWCVVGTATGALTLSFLSWGRSDLTFEEGGFVLPLSSGALVVAGGCLVGLFILVIVDKKYFPKAILRLLDVEGSGPLVPMAVPLYHLLHYAAWTLCGASLAWALGQSFVSGLWAGASLCLAIVGGFLALLAPAGAGVREVILTYCMAPFWGPSLALSFSILARAVSLLSDVGMWIAARLLSPRSTTAVVGSDS